MNSATTNVPTDAEWALDILNADSGESPVRMNPNTGFWDAPAPTAKKRETAAERSARIRRAKGLRPAITWR